MTQPSTPQGRTPRQGRGRGRSRKNDGRGKSGRGGRGGRRGRGGGSGRSGGGGSHHNNNQNHDQRNKYDHNTSRRDGPSSGMSEEDVMIAFMHHLRSGDDDAKKMHLMYGNDPKLFVQNAREFLEKKGTSSPASTTADDNHSSQRSQPREVQFRPKPSQAHNMSERKPRIDEQEMPSQAANVAAGSTRNEMTRSDMDQNDSTRRMQEMVANLTLEKNSQNNNLRRHQVSSPVPTLPSEPVQMRPPPGMHSQLSNGDRQPNNYPPTPPSTPQQQGVVTPITTPVTTHGPPPPGMPTFQNISQQQQVNVPVEVMPSSNIQAFEGHVTTPSKPIVANPSTLATPEPLPPPATPTPSEPPATPAPPTTPAPPKWQPKRLNTRLQEQPGRILANNAPATLDGSQHLNLRPREELTATWQLPLQYLRERTLAKLAKDKEAGTTPPNATPESLTIRDALRSLTVGLFRRGGAENGSNSSIISKEVVPVDASQKEYHFEVNNQNNTIWGTVPFFTPRTPGNVVLRLYFEDDAIMTLATSRCISVVVTQKDLEQTLRFILSNFKSKRGSTNFSSIHSLAAVLEQYTPSSATNNHSQYNQHSKIDGAGRAAWGGICESRKVVDGCRQDYLKKKMKLEKQIEALNQLKEELDARTEVGDDGNDGEEVKSCASSESKPTEDNEELKEWKEKMNSTMGERASNERKWREIQTAFASVLKSVIKNPHASSLLKPDIIKKLELEYYLWCPLCESFAPNPFEDDESDGMDNGSKNFKYPYPIQKKHLRLCSTSRAKMQEETLGFVVKNAYLSASLFESGVGASLSEAMMNYYKAEYGDHVESSYRKKSTARGLAENAVSACKAFPEGTQVVVFGSSANGFGSPRSDLDMCLQLPQVASFTAEEGAAAMGILAEVLKEKGMQNVDVSRLTARIPVIQFNCPVEIDGHESIIECDISMQNPLACINTSLLKNYSMVNPSVRIIASIVKKWAKRRNINDPSHHTLSSYGYIIMILHFMTTRAVSQRRDLTSIFQKNNPQCPLLPNLQWMDQRFLQGSPYAEYQQKPRSQYTTMKHPTETSYVVNTHFFRINDQTNLNALKQRIATSSPPAPSIGYILTSFFHYFAFEFDYKKHIVSLQATSQTGLSEREAKAESDGWKLYGQSLCIEDPFEEFYDVAHVLKATNFQRTRREFALAYSKIQSSMSEGVLDGEKLIELFCEEYPSNAH